MKYKVHWLIDGLVEIDANDTEIAEKIIKEKIESFVENNASFFKKLEQKLYRVKHISQEMMNNSLEFYDVKFQE